MAIASASDFLGRMSCASTWGIACTCVSAHHTDVGRLPASAGSTGSCVCSSRFLAAAPLVLHVLASVVCEFVAGGLVFTCFSCVVCVVICGTVQNYTLDCSPALLSLSRKSRGRSRSGKVGSLARRATLSPNETLEPRDYDEERQLPDGRTYFKSFPWAET
eukprot:COSAG02_NODE_1016_length_15190_cov_128.667418_1_plen_161_part_00